MDWKSSELGLATAKLMAKRSANLISILLGQLKKVAPSVASRDYLTDLTLTLRVKREHKGTW